MRHLCQTSEYYLSLCFLCSPLARCSTFTKMWESPAADDGNSLRKALRKKEAGAMLGVTFWRPLPPIGYAVLGHCAARDADQPSFQVTHIPHAMAPARPLLQMHSDMPGCGCELDNALREHLLTEQRCACWLMSSAALTRMFMMTHQPDLICLTWSVDVQVDHGLQCCRRLRLQ